MSQWVIVLLLIIACPLMHYLMMRKGHHRDCGHGGHNDEDKKVS